MGVISVNSILLGLLILLTKINLLIAVGNTACPCDPQTEDSHACICYECIAHVQYPHGAAGVITVGTKKWAPDLCPDISGTYPGMVWTAGAGAGFPGNHPHALIYERNGAAWESAFARVHRLSGILGQVFNNPCNAVGHSFAVCWYKGQLQQRNRGKNAAGTGYNDMMSNFNAEDEYYNMLDNYQYDAAIEEARETRAVNRLKREKAKIQQFRPQKHKKVHQTRYH
eukprot:208796_1